MKAIIAWLRENIKILRPKKKPNFNKSVYLPNTKHNTSYDSSFGFSHKSVRTSSNKRRSDFSSQPRIHKRSTGLNAYLNSSSKIDNIRKMRMRDLRKDRDFMDDVDECLLNIKQVPSLK